MLLNFLLGRGGFQNQRGGVSQELACLEDFARNACQYFPVLPIGKADCTVGS